MGNRVFIFICMSIWIVVASSCMKDNIIPIYNQEENKEIIIDNKTQEEAPHWRVESPYIYSNTMSAIFKEPDAITDYEPSDELAIFMDETCRGVAEHVNIEGIGPRWFILIYGNVDKEKLYFKYYSSREKCIYKSLEVLSFSTDSRYGSVDNPQIITFEPFK